MLCGIEPVLATLQPDVVVVQGDTNSALAGAMAASKLEIAVAHVEAGLRSRDRSMPEEVNRVLIDHLSDYLFCPTALQAQILRDEGLTGARIRITGNTVADATLAHAQTALRRSTILQRLGLREGGYHLLTCHRRSNTEDPAHFAALMQAVTSISEDQGLPLVFPMHPRLDALGSVAAARHRVLRAIGPVGYLDMLALQQGAALIMTDSGGIQEEACILQRKCLVLRTNTERPETLQIGGAELPTAWTRTPCGVPPIACWRVRWHGAIPLAMAMRFAASWTRSWRGTNTPARRVRACSTRRRRVAKVSARRRAMAWLVLDATQSRALGRPHDIPDFGAPLSSTWWAYSSATARAACREKG